jgi:hypothetical protein
LSTRLGRVEVSSEKFDSSKVEHLKFMHISHIFVFSFPGGANELSLLHDKQEIMIKNDQNNKINTLAKCI